MDPHVPVAAGGVMMAEVSDNPGVQCDLKECGDPDVFKRVILEEVALRKA